MISFGCNPCKQGNHNNCDSLYTSIEVNGKTRTVRRLEPSPTHCDCQHRTGVK